LGYSIEQVQYLAKANIEFIRYDVSIDGKYWCPFKLLVTSVYSVVLCEYLKFRIESNSYLSIRFGTSSIIQNFGILTVTVTNFLLI